jgi:hypothetical protein
MKKIINTIAAPFVSLSVLIDESRRQNLDGEWDSYWAKKNRKAELREHKAEYRRNKTAIRNKWRIEK